VPPIISKLLAGGLSAAVVLLWYPLFFPTDSVESWLIRGVVITLIFEILVHSLAPLETALWETARARQMRAGAARLARAQRERPLRSRSFVAVCAITVPVALMAIAPPHELSHSTAQRTAVRHVTEVKRVVKVEHRTVAMAARPTTAGVESAAATPEPPATGYTRPVRRTTTAPTDSKRSDAKSGNTSSHSTPSAEPDSTGDSADTSQPATSPTQSTTPQPATDSADTTAQPKPRAVAPSRIA
jgi:cobalamin biosynthesis Mg chelatase CobN